MYVAENGLEERLHQLEESLLRLVHLLGILGLLPSSGVELDIDGLFMNGQVRGDEGNEERK